MTTTDYVRELLTMSDEDYNQQRPTDNAADIDALRFFVSLTEEDYEHWRERIGYDPCVEFWRLDFMYRRELYRLQQVQTIQGRARLPQQASLFDRAQLDGEGVYIHSDGTAAKFGRTAVSERNRRRSHQTGNPRDLVLLAWLPGASEDRMLERFDHLHIRGEWYRLDPELLEFIRAWQLVEGVFD
jgi:hypothetical protein